MTSKNAKSFRMERLLRDSANIPEVHETAIARASGTAAVKAAGVAEKEVQQQQTVWSPFIGQQQQQKLMAPSGLPLVPFQVPMSPAYPFPSPPLVSPAQPAFGSSLPFNPFVAAATAALLQQQRHYQMALLRHFMTPLSTPERGIDTSGGTATWHMNSSTASGSSSTAHYAQQVRMPAPVLFRGVHPNLRQMTGMVNRMGVPGGGPQQGGTPRARPKPKNDEENPARAEKGMKVQCEICQKSFGRPWLLTGHKRTHNGERPYRCQLEGCDRAFADRSNCRAHERTHLPEKPFKCGNCGKSFKLNSYLAKHQRANACRLQRQPQDEDRV